MLSLEEKCQEFNIGEDEIPIVVKFFSEYKNGIVNYLGEEYKNPMQTDIIVEENNKNDVKKLVFELRCGYNDCGHDYLVVIQECPEDFKYK